MARPKSANPHLPANVHCITKPNGRKYYYYQPRRNRSDAAKRIALGTDPTDPEFWQTLKSAQHFGPLTPPKQTGTFADLIGEYRSSREWSFLKPKTQSVYGSYLDQLMTIAGDRLVAEATRMDIYKLRDSMAGTPVSANHMIGVLRMLIEWGVPRGYREDNPAVGITKLKTDVAGAEPWPEEAYQFVMAHAPDDLRRMAFLGRACGQRREDLVALRGANLGGDGLIIKISKLRDRKHFIPLTQRQVEEITSWRVGELDFFLKSPAGNPYTGDGLNSRWNRWRKASEAEPIKHLKLTIHGLRATAVCDRREAGTEDGAIADEIGMSVAMVSRYARFADKARSARASRDRREARG